MRKIIFLLLLCLPALASAQTVANFDTPPCSGNGIQIYQGIDFSVSQWDCEKANIPGDSTTTLSWYRNIQSGTFKFVSPAVLVSLNLGISNSGSNGTFTVSTDAGESLTQAVTKNTIVNVTTNFKKPASIVTVAFTGGWTLELDNIAYTAAVTPPPPPPPPPPATPKCSSIAVTVLGTNLLNVTATVANLPIQNVSTTASTLTGTLLCSSVTLTAAPVIVTSHSATLSWTPSTSNVTGYRVYRSQTSGVFTTPLSGILINGSTFTDSTVNSGQNYFYVVTAVDASGNESANSNQVTAVIP